MNPPAPVPGPETPQRAMDLLDFLTKAAGLAVIFAGFLKWAWKPYVDWRRRRMAELIHDVLKQELDQLSTVVDAIGRIETVTDQIKILFSEYDLMMDVVIDNRQRMDETNDLLDGMIPTQDRRRREPALQVFEELMDRRRVRRRKLDINEEESHAHSREE